MWYHLIIVFLREKALWFMATIRLVQVIWTAVLFLINRNIKFCAWDTIFLESLQWFHGFQCGIFPGFVPPSLIFPSVVLFFSWLYYVVFVVLFHQVSNMTSIHFPLPVSSHAPVLGPFPMDSYETNSWKWANITWNPTCSGKPFLDTLECSWNCRLEHQKLIFRSPCQLLPLFGMETDSTFTER